MVPLSPAPVVMSSVLALATVLAAFTVKHVLADFVLQSNWMARGKEAASGWAAPLLAHVACHAGLTLLLVLAVRPDLWWLALADLVVHTAVDRSKALFALRVRWRNGPASVLVAARHRPGPASAHQHRLGHSPRPALSRPGRRNGRDRFRASPVPDTAGIGAQAAWSDTSVPRMPRSIRSAWKRSRGSSGNCASSASTASGPSASPRDSRSKASP